jgi:hypothetical protein
MQRPAPSHTLAWAQPVPALAGTLTQRPLVQVLVVHESSSSQSALLVHWGGGGGAQMGVRRAARARRPESHQANRSQPSRVEKFTVKTSGWLPDAKSTGCPWFLGCGTKKLSVPIGTFTLRALEFV